MRGTEQLPALQQGGGDAVQVAHLLLDDSNKGVNPSVLPFTARFGDGVVRDRALCTVASLTKKSDASRRLLDSMDAKVRAIGIVRITGGTTDAFEKERAEKRTKAELQALLSAHSSLSENALEKMNKDALVCEAVGTTGPMDGHGDRVMA